MPLFEPVYPARYAAPLLDFLRNGPSDCLQACLLAAQIDEGEFSEPEHALTMSQVDALVIAASHHLRRSDLGFELGKRIRLDHHLGLSDVLRRCRTIDEMLRLLCRFYRLVTPSFALHYQRSPDRGQFTCRPAAFMSATTLRFFEEEYALAVHTEYRSLFRERMPALDIYLSMEAPAHAARYAELHPTRVHFAALPMPAVQFVFDADVLDLPMLWPEVAEPLIGKRNDGASTPLEPDHLQELHGRFARRRQWGDWVGLLLREAEGCQPGREEIAALLGTSPSTLTRQLQAEGTTLRAMGLRIRHQRALQLLNATTQPISQIAYRLGYTDTANFSHAFSKLAGMSPRAYRRQAGSPGNPQAAAAGRRE